MKTLQDMIKDLTGVTVEKNKINDYLESEPLAFFGADLSGANLRFADLKYANLRCANLRFADLRFADLIYADLQDANLIGAHLHDAKITKKQLEQLTVVVEEE